tara:strand:+ start:314369 stop:315745 length:1377 start_codon:yes stop_codon:yes gene_type:complete
VKRLLKYILIASISCVFLIYALMSGFLWWSEANLPKDSGLGSLHINSEEQHKLLLIDSGKEGLKRRIDAIESAQTTIELEYFIYELDLASQIITQKLIEAASRGVEIKILVDFSAPVFKLRPQYASFLNKYGIKVRYYNTAPLFQFINIQHRSHRKFLIVDSKTVITGGRNIGSDYFDLSTHYNFLDTDIQVTGPIVKDIRKSFNSYWESSLASEPELITETITGFVNQTEVKRVLSSLDAQIFPKAEFECNNIDFVTDSPGLELKNRKVYSYLENKLASAKESVFGESPYFVLRPDGLNLLASLAERNIKQTYLTNSLYSTDAYYTVSAFLPVADNLLDLGIKLYLYNGKALEPDHQSRWGLHAKRAVIDGRHTLIGTYNIDPRSANLNSEVLISCNDNELLAKRVLSSMKSRRKNAWQLQDAKSDVYTVITKEAAWRQKIKMLVVLPLAKIFDFLL